MKIAKTSNNQSATGTKKDYLHGQKKPCTPSSSLQLVDTETVAKMLSVKPNSLVVARHTKAIDLAYIRIGRRVLYDLADITAFVERHKVYPFSPDD